MASEAATVFLGLIGIAVVAVGVMILMQRQQNNPIVEERVVARPRDYQWRGHYYSHLPVRPVIYG